MSNLRVEDWDWLGKKGGDSGGTEMRIWDGELETRLGQMRGDRAEGIRFVGTEPSLEDGKLG